VRNRRYNTRVFEWTPGEGEDETQGRPRHYIYCDNNEGVIGHLSCSVTLYEGHWREIEYNARRQRFEVKGELAFLHGFDKEEPLNALPSGRGLFVSAQSGKLRERGEGKGKQEGKMVTKKMIFP
jgi:hypothetical protein